MEFFITEGIFIELETMAKPNRPEGIFSLAIGFLITVISKIKAMPLWNC